MKQLVCKELIRSAAIRVIGVTGCWLKLADLLTDWILYEPVLCCHVCRVFALWELYSPTFYRNFLVSLLAGVRLSLFVRNKELLAYLREVDEFLSQILGKCYFQNFQTLQSHVEPICGRFHFHLGIQLHVEYVVTFAKIAFIQMEFKFRTN